MFGSLICFAQTFDAPLVILAALVCGAASTTTFNLLPRAMKRHGQPDALLWLVLTAVTAAAGIWSTHFIAMLAFEPEVSRIGYDPAMTALSLLVAMGVVAFAVAAVAQSRHRFGAVLGGCGLGLGTSLMHYTGIRGMAVAGRVEWHLGGVAASVLLAVGLGTAAVLACGTGESRGRRLSAGLLFSLAIVSLHFTGMAAVSIVPDPTVAMPEQLLTGSHLAWVVAGGTMLVIGAAVIAFLVDVSARRDGDARFGHLVRHDALTGLPNRLHFEEIARRTLAAELAAERRSALLSIDIAGFRDINSIYGQAVGDAVLEQVAERLRGLLGPRCAAARVGADEFLLLAGDIGWTRTLPAVIQAVCATLAGPLTVGAHHIELDFNIGAVQSPEDGTEHGMLMARANLALAKAKTEGRNAARCYDGSLDEEINERHRLTADLRRALDGGQLALHFQPQVDPVTQGLLGFEALLRWAHPVHGPVPPGRFIPLAEESGLIQEIGAWVIRTACAQASSWAQPLRVAVNVSPAQFRRPGLLEVVRSALAESGLAAGQLEIEITESLFFDKNSRALQVLGDLQALGVRVGMDDFGTGFSSLSTLQAFPFDTIKIDRSFTALLGEAAKPTAIVRAIVGLARSLHIEIVAEGVETPRQAAMLRDLGCTSLQGYFFGRPLPIDDYAGVIDADSRRLRFA